MLVDAVDDSRVLMSHAIHGCSGECSRRHAHAKREDDRKSECCANCVLFEACKFHTAYHST